MLGILIVFEIKIKLLCMIDIKVGINFVVSIYKKFLCNNLRKFLMIILKYFWVIYV